MMVIHVIRKPLSEGNVASNVLKWGAGGLNIEVSRIASHSGSTSQQPSGRWPANLLIEHKAGCQHVGEVTVQGNKLASRGLGGQNGSYSPIGTEGGHDFTDADGNETVQAWECVEGCPAASLDESIEGGPSRYFKQMRG